ncbi:hypothetical protein CGH78_23175 [Vibrio parahaemolyticus]|uniref:hypothetical protein n=1 Tax=Vibrio parahaemolyticus TaxID=670 RepID=UPI00112284B5|nr:hypothetical protein [Vibrio parahaemolyticus]TOM30499.1 hypothetical protein CGH78_23175 [Vibrio parahaemolyticus]
MNSLGKAASLATIVAAVFTVLAYFDSGSTEPVLSEREDLTLDSVQISLETDMHPDTSRKLSPSVSMPYDCETESYTEEQLRKRFVIAKKIPGSTSKNDALEELAKRATAMCFYDVAFEVASSIPGTTTKNATLSYIALKVAKSGNIDKAAEIAYTIPGTVTKNRTLKEISKL